MSLRSPEAQAQLASYRASRKREAELFTTQRRRDRALIVIAAIFGAIALWSVINAIVEVRHVLS